MHDSTRRLFLAALVATGLMASASGQTPLTSVRLASGLTQPVWVGSPPGDEDRLFVLEQPGRIKIIKNGAVLATPFLDIVSRVLAGGERGLLGMAFHPQYDQNGFFYVNYTRRTDGATMVERFTVSANPDLANPGTGVVVIGPISQPFSNHNGGDLQFGPNDGYLYVALGDGGSGGDPGCRAQSGATLLGKILRLDVDGPTLAPPTNPFVGNPEFLDEIWTYGWRNPWRFSFDRANGDMYVGDVGQNAREEISFQKGTSTGGENYGWKIMEGPNCFSTSNCTNPPPCNSPSLELPIHSYATGSNCAVIGGYVYRGCAIPDLAGTYFFADNCSARIWSFRFDGVTVSSFTERTNELRPAVGTINSISSFGEDDRGEILIVDRGGEIYKIIAAGPPVAVNLGFGKVGGNGLEPLFEVCGLLSPGLSAQFILRQAPASTPAALLLSTSNAPTVFSFGTIVPIPVLLGVGFTTDADGRVEFKVNGAPGPATAYGQWLLLDPGASEGLGVSNALAINFPP